MAKYTLKALNVVLFGKLFKKEDNFIFDDEKMNKAEIQDAVKGGFLVPVVKKETAAERNAREKAEAEAAKQAEAEAKAAEEAELAAAIEAEEKAKAEAEANKE